MASKRAIFLLKPKLFMKKTLNKFLTFPIKNPILVILLTVAISAVLAFGNSKIEFKDSYRVFFAKDNPELQELDKFEKIYTKTDNLIFIIKSKSGSVFTSSAINFIKELTAESWKIKDVSRVDSITNYQHTYAEGSDELIVTDLVKKETNSFTEKELLKIKEISLSEPMMRKKIISEDASTTAVALTILIPEKTKGDEQEIIKQAQDLLSKLATKHDISDLEIRLSGLIAMNNAFTEMSIKDSATLLPLMLFFVILMTALFTKSFTATISVILVSAIAIITGIGLAGYCGIDMSSVTASTPNVILTVAVADVIHILVIMINLMRGGMKKKDAIAKSLEMNFTAIVFTNITTIIGFLGLNFAEVPPFRDLGNMVGFGVLICLILSFTFLPALLSLLPMQVKEIPDFSKMEDRLSHKISKFIIRNSAKILVFFSVITIAGSYFMVSKIELNDRFIEYFDESVEFRQDAEFMMKNLTGIYTGDYSLNSKGPEGISDPEYLMNLEKFQKWIEQQPEIFQASSIADIMKRLNKNMHGDNDDFYKIPAQKELSAQYLLLYEMSLPYGLDLTDRINIDKSSSRLSFSFKNISSVEMRDFATRSENWQKQNLPEYMFSKATGPNILFNYISERNIRSMIWGTIVSTLTTCILIAFLFKSLRIGIISLLPNITPILVSMGIWALIIGHVNMAVAFISSITFGIIVDDTIHMLSKFYHAKDKLKYNVEDSIVYAFKISGEAIFVTTAILVVGFSILGFSHFVPNKFTGILSAIVISTALFFDIFGLPALLNLIYRNKQK